MNREAAFGIIACLVLTVLGSLIGGSLALAVGPKHVTEVVNHNRVIREVQTRVQDKEVPQKSCLDGKDGIVTATHSAHVSISDNDHPDAWDWGNTIAFEVDGVNRVCYFESSNDLVPTFIIGKKYHPYGGTPE